MRSRGFSRGSSDNSGAQGHNLTSLVDCFAIILIYLLMATSIGDLDMEIPDGMKLPKASKGQAVTGSTIVQVHNHAYIIKGKTVPMGNLVLEFKRIFDSIKSSGSQQKTALVVEADQSAGYAEINPVVLAGLQVGFEDVQFAVLKEE